MWTPTFVPLVSGGPDDVSSFVNVRFPFTHTAPHEIHLGLYSWSQGDGLETFASSIWIDAMTAPPQAIEVPVRHHGIVTSRDAGNVLGVGPGSDLQQQNGAISVVRNLVSNTSHPGFIILGMSEYTFVNQLCEANSVIRIPTHYDHLSPMPVLVTRLRVAIAGQNMTDVMMGQISYGRSLLTLPYAVGAPIFRLIQPENEGAFESLVFGNCTQKRAELPIIALVFASGELRLAPEDYTKNIGNDACELLINRAGINEDISHVRINLMILKDMNFRSTSNEILVCDAAL